jgi:hypothetical protein
MQVQNKRLILFLIGCMGTRLALVWIAAIAAAHKHTILQWMGYLALIPAIGFLYFYLTGTRQSGPEVFGDRIWWNALRPIHAVLLLSFAVLAISNITARRHLAWKVLLLDTVIGLVAFIVHRQH